MKLSKILIFLFLFLLISPKIVAAYSGVNSLDQWRGSVYDTGDFNLESHTNETFKNLALSAVESIVPDPEHADKAGPGALAALGGLIGKMYAAPPASSYEYFADLGRNLGIAKPAYAQGVGFSGLVPILGLWKAFRNIAYFFFVIIFVALGFAIMFRAKIDPKTVITIQNALPRVIITLILVTFSYAIAGLLIDLIYIILAILIAALGASGLIKDVGVVQSSYFGSGFMGVIGAVFGGGLRSLDDLAKLVFPIGETIGPAIGAIMGGVVGGGIPGALIGGGLGFLLGGIISSIIAALILLILLLYIVFKLFITLLTAYISIILAIIFAPLQIMLGALPGQAGFSGWLKNLVANLLVFPVVAGLLLIGAILTSSNPSGLWAPPMLAFPGATSSAVTGLIGLGILMAAPKAAELVKGAFQIKEGKPTDFGPLSWFGKGVSGGVQKQVAGYALGGSLRNPEAGPGLRSDISRRVTATRDFFAGRAGGGRGEAGGEGGPETQPT